MFKLKFTVCFASIAGFLTIIVSILKDIRVLTTLYRMSISVIIFGIIGYLCGYVTENYLNVLVDKLNPKGQNLDTISEKEDTDSVTQPEPNHFSPFNKNDFEHIS